MADLSGGKPGPKVFPEQALESEHDRFEPLITPQQLRYRHLFGVTLVSQMQDPISKASMVMTDEMLKDIIEGAVNQAEEELNIDIWPVQRQVKFPFDRNMYESFGYMMLPHRPVTSLQSISITPSNGQTIYEVPLDWVEVANLPRGQVNIIPMTAAFIQGGYIPTGSTGGAFFLSILGNRQWIPAYWQAEYVSGFINSLMPRIVNELIGTIAALEILSQLAVTYARSQSHSLSIDGMSQSVSTPGPQIFAQRIEELQAKKDKLISKLKARYNRKIFSSNV